jgi:hypothetical protein
MIGIVPPRAASARHGGGVFVRLCDEMGVCWSVFAAKWIPVRVKKTRQNKK